MAPGTPWAVPLTISPSDAGSEDAVGTGEGVCSRGPSRPRGDVQIPSTCLRLSGTAKKQTSEWPVPGESFAADGDEHLAAAAETPDDGWAKRACPEPGEGSRLTLHAISRPQLIRGVDRRSDPRGRGMGRSGCDNDAACDRATSIGKSAARTSAPRLRMCGQVKGPAVRRAYDRRLAFRAERHSSGAGRAPRPPGRGCGDTHGGDGDRGAVGEREVNAAEGAEPAGRARFRDGRISGRARSRTLTHWNCAATWPSSAAAGAAGGDGGGQRRVRRTAGRSGAGFRGLPGTGWASTGPMPSARHRRYRSVSSSARCWPGRSSKSPQSSCSMSRPPPSMVRRGMRWRRRSPGCAPSGKSRSKLVTHDPEQAGRARRSDAADRRGKDRVRVTPIDVTLGEVAASIALVVVAIAISSGAGWVSSAISSSLWCGPLSS